MTVDAAADDGLDGGAPELMTADAADDDGLLDGAAPAPMTVDAAADDGPAPVDASRDALPSTACPPASLRAVLKRVQHGSATMDLDGSKQIRIDAVDPARSLVIFHSRHASNRPPGSALILRLAGPGALEMVRPITAPTATIDVTWSVVEFESGMRVQRGTVRQAARETIVSIDPVAAEERTLITWSKATGANDSGWDRDPTVATLDGPGRLRLLQGDITSPHEVGWQVAEILNEGDLIVHRGMTSFANGQRSKTINLPGALLSGRSGVLLDTYGEYGEASNVTQMGARLFLGKLPAEDSLLIERDVAGEAEPGIGWQAWQWGPGVIVQSVEAHLSPGVLQQKVPLAQPVSLDRSWAMASMQNGAGASTGASDFVGDDIPGACSATLALAPDRVTVTRAFDRGTCRMAFFVITFPSPPGDLASGCPSAP